MRLFTPVFARFLCSALFVAGLSHAAHSQRTISGRVVDVDSGEPLVGATIVEKENRTNGAIADYDGNFRLRVSERATAIVVTYSSYVSKELGIAGLDNVVVQLSPSSILDEVVVIGYGTVKKEDATGAVQTAGTAIFNRGAITGPQELVAGKIAGVVVTSDGSPGGGAQIRVRGLSSLNAAQDPLIVVDGVPLDNSGISGSRNPLNVVNPNDIETFTVLKDASAAAIYGNRASGGVILITTKKGKLGRRLQVGYNGNVSWGVRAGEIDVLGADQFRSVIQERYADDPAVLGTLGTANTDWQREIYQTAFGTDQNVNFSGGVGIVPYRVSLGYTFKEGLLKTDEFKRYSAAINLSPGFFNNTLQTNFNLKTALSDNHFADRGAIGNALSFDPTRPVRDPSSRFGGFTTWVQNNGLPNGLAPANPVALLELRDDNSTVKQIITSLNLDYRMPFLPDLRANLNVGYERGNGEGTVVAPTFAAFAFDTLNGGGVNNRYTQRKENTLLEAYLNYRKRIGIHGLDIMGGYSWQHFEFKNSFRNANAAGTPSETNEDDGAGEYYLISLFGRINYDIADKYFLTVSLRRDGTSRFSPDNRWGFFPAAAVGVKLFDNDRDHFNFLKLRAGWGVTGQQDIGLGYYPYLPVYQQGLPNAQYQLGNTFVPTFRPNGYVSNIKWEETASVNLGADFSLVRDRVGGSIDVYQRNTSDLLSNIPFPALSNLTNFLTTNIGEMQSRGVELGLLLTPVRTRKITWDVNANVAYNLSKITKLRNDKDTTFQGIQTGGIAGGVGSTIQINSVGFEPNAFYVYQQKYDETGKLLEGQFEDRNGDGQITALDFYRFQSPNPNYTFGLTSNLQVGRVGFSFAGRANLGQYVYNNVQTDMGYLDRLVHPTGYLANVHQSAVDLQVAQQANLTFSDHFVKKADFFRMDHITLSYDLTSLFGRQQGQEAGSGQRNPISFFNVYATVQNPFVVTRYDGIDPEIANGIDNTVYPRPRTYLLGVNVNF